MAGREMTLTEASPSTLPLDHLEFHRKGIGLLRPRRAGERGSAAFVSRGAGDESGLKTCSCAGARSKRKTCAHLAELQELVDECHGLWRGRSWADVFQATVWYRLAERLFDADRLPCARIGLTVGGVGLALYGGDGALRLRTGTLGPSSERLLDRCGVAPGVDPALSRARLLDQLQLLQVSDHERALHERGMPTHRHAFEASFWHRLAYHCVREYGTGGAFHPAVDEGTADFVLSFHPPRLEPPLRLVLPKAAVEGALAILAAAHPDQSDLQVRPIPLASIFKISATTELDLDVRPLVRVMQADGEARYLEREEVERFRYGRLVYVRELGVLAELESPDRVRRFIAPVRMQLQASQVPRLLEELGAAGDQAPALVDTEGRDIRVLKTFDALDVTPHTRDGARYWTTPRYVFGEASVPLADVLRARHEKLPFLPTRDGWVDVAAPAFEALDRLTAARDPDALDGDRVRLSPRELLSLRGGSEGPLRVQGAASALVERLLALQPSMPVPAPGGLLSPLRAYQKVGLDWLMFLYENELSGLLCDDMGLGKTHQVLALLATLVERGVAEPFLVVCPTSVVSHWRDKVQAHAPTLPLVLYHGQGRDLPAAEGGHIVLTSYGVLRNDIERLRGMRFAVAVFDEIQQLKNSGTLGYQAAERVDARTRVGLTGTPIENNVGELKSLVDLMLPEYLGTDRQFADRFGSTSARGAQPGHGALRRALSPFLLRRLKSAVLHELPEKTEDIRGCTLSAEQDSLYREALSAKAGPLLDTLRQADRPVPYLHVFALLNVLKRICDHPALARRCPEDHVRHASGKWDAFEEILDESLASGQKVIVFTQYLGMVDIFERALRARDIGFATLVGATRDRGAAIARFNDDDRCRVFVASLKAAGHGIDLVAGSVVIHYDRWWNAAREDQATDRAHRIGQKRAVQVFKLVTEGTLEERISTMIEDKRRLMESVVHADEPGLAKTFSREELIRLLGPLLDRG